MPISSFINVVQRHVLNLAPRQEYLFPMLEPLFMIPTHMSFAERLALFQTAAGLREGFVACEVGSYFGASTAFLAAGASLRQGHVHAVDTWQNDAMPHEPIVDTYPEFARNVQLYRHHISVHRGQARDMKDRIPSVDLLFIDGDHSYQAVKNDLESYAGKIVPQGILALHDFNYESVQQAVSEHFQGRKLTNLGLTHSLQIFKLP